MPASKPAFGFKMCPSAANQIAPSVCDVYFTENSDMEREDEAVTWAA